MALNFARHPGLLAATAALLLAGCRAGPAVDEASAARLADSASGGDWAGYGRTDGQQHFSPLDDINGATAGQLGLAWSLDLPAANSVTQPIAVDGVLYFAAGLSVVSAVDATTGKLLWSHDPETGKAPGINQRVGWGVRGLAWWAGKVYVGTTDGRLIALDAKSGKPVWTTQTFPVDAAAYISGAPRAFGGLILIGSGSTTGAMRGYVAAFDAVTGKEVWRFHTVPGNPADGFENAAMAMAAKTWAGEWWTYGGGGMVWNSMAFDPALGLVYIGVGSPYPWNHRIRSKGQGDNLFVGSIVALDVKTGAYRWHYQTVPGDTWDLDATMDIELAELRVNGTPRKVLMQAPKNGFFYVLDRATGELLSARPYTKVTWASHVDLKTGRPVEMPGARYDRTGKPVVISPTALAGHNWLPMAFSAKTGLVYIPTVNWEARYGDIAGDFVLPKDRSTSGGVNLAGGPLAGMPRPTGSLIAFDPLTGKTAWKIDQPTYFNGGVLATAGNLVFQGTIDGRFRAHDAITGRPVWAFDAKAPMIAPPIAYKAGGNQMVTVLTGLGMGYSMNGPSLFGPQLQRYGIDPLSQGRRVLTFALGGTGAVPERKAPAAAPADPGFRADALLAGAGLGAYQRNCSVCHGDLAIGIANGPDLRRSGVILDAQGFDQVVRRGVLKARGMPPFAELTDDSVAALRHYLRSRAAELRGEIPSAPAAPATMVVR